MSNPIRILHVIGVMNRGGAETMIMNLYRNIDRSKIQFDFVENEGEVAAFDEEIQFLGGRIYHCPLCFGRNYFAYTKWWKAFFDEHKGEYSIVHGHIGSTAAIYLSVAKKYGAYVIAHSHNSRGTWGIRNLIYRIASFRTRFIADYFFGCSSVAGKDRFGKRVATDKKRFVVLNNAIDADMYDFNRSIRSSIRDELGLGHELVIGHVGRFHPAKNHTFLIDVFREINKIQPSARLLLVGGGNGMAEIRKKVSDYGLDSKVLFTGVRDDVNCLLQAIDVFVFPSLYEGLPVTIVEAQASGLPCVISDKISTECIITDGLVTVKKLSDSAEEWAKHAIKQAEAERTGHAEEVRSHGYDIKTTSKWLEEFYIEKNSVRH